MVDNSVVVLPPMSGMMVGVLGIKGEVMMGWAIEAMGCDPSSERIDG